MKLVWYVLWTLIVILETMVFRMYINSVVTNKVIEGFNTKKMLIIITEKEEEVSNALMQDLTMGVFFLVP